MNVNLKSIHAYNNAWLIFGHRPAIALWRLVKAYEIMCYIKGNFAPTNVCSFLIIIYKGRHEKAVYFSFQLGLLLDVNVDCFPCLVILKLLKIIWFLISNYKTISVLSILKSKTYCGNAWVTTLKNYTPKKKISCLFVTFVKPNDWNV